MSNEFNNAVRSIPSAPGCIPPPNRGGNQSLEAVNAINAVVAQLKDAQQHPGPAYSFRSVTVGVSDFRLTTEALEVVIRELKRRKYDVAFKGTCDPKGTDLADGALIVGWQY